MYDEHEFEEHSLPAELAALERQLTGLTPAALRVDRDRLMFAAGRASADAGAAGPLGTGSKFWPVSAAFATAASVILATMLVWQRTETGLTAKPQAADVSDVEPMVAQRDHWRWSDRLPSGYLGVRQVALTRGVGALEYELPAASEGEMGEPAPPATARQLLEELLPKPTHTSS